MQKQIKQDRQPSYKHGKFFTLSDGSEILITPEDLPEPTYDDLPDNPYKVGSKQYNKFHTLSLANYYKAKYAERIKEEELKIEVLKLPDMNEIIKNPQLWEQYLKEKKLLRDEQGQTHEYFPRKYCPKSRKEKRKKIDIATELLGEEGYRVENNAILDPKGNTLGTLLINGKVELKENGYRISVYQFLKEKK